MEKCLDNGKDVHDRYVAAKNEYEKIQDSFTKGMIVRSRAKWVEDWEKITKYFLQLEKQNFKTECIWSLKCDEKIFTLHLILWNYARNFMKICILKQNKCKHSIRLSFSKGRASNA